MFMLLGALALLGAGLAFPEEALAGDVFDRPLMVRHVRLKADPLNPRTKREVSCFTYPQFVVKQVDLGEVGADRLSIIPVASGRPPTCRQAKAQGEYIIPDDIWSGYVKGIKSDFVFFDAADGTNGGLGFTVLRASDKKKLFEDTARKNIRSIEIPVAHPIRVAHGVNGVGGRALPRAEERPAKFADILQGETS